MISFPHKIGAEANRKRDQVKMSTRSDQEILEGITGSREGSKSLLAEFTDMKALSVYGSKHGFGRLSVMPGVSWAVVGKLESWLESIGRVTS